MSHALAILLGYLLGSIPFGLILTRIAGTTDPRSIGSGNIGATNVLRTGRKSLAAATLLGDMLKGTVAVLIAGALWGPAESLTAGVAAFFGHLFPVWLRFRGGKGVATYIGVLLAISLPATAGYALIWIATAAATRYSSLAALVAALATPPMLWFADLKPAAAIFLGLTALIFITHRSNLGRLLNGTESRIGRAASPPPTRR